MIFQRYLEELAQTPVLVVCAGAKAILDLGLTLEYLETYGVPVLGYQTDEFPAFYCATSGYGVDYKVKDAKEVAQAKAAGFAPVTLGHRILRTETAPLVVLSWIMYMVEQT